MLRQRDELATFGVALAARWFAFALTGGGLARRRGRANSHSHSAFTITARQS
jgi:hypothetical protein